MRWFVVLENLEDDGNYLRDEYPVLYGTEDEAKEMLAKLQAGCDKSYYDPADPKGILVIESW